MPVTIIVKLEERPEGMSYDYKMNGVATELEEHLGRLALEASTKVLDLAMERMGTSKVVESKTDQTKHLDNPGGGN